MSSIEEAGRALIAALTQIHGSTRRNARELGAVGDGIADDTDAIEALFAELSSGTGLEVKHGFLPAGTYRVTRPLVLRGAGNNVRSFVLDCEGHNNNAGHGCRIIYDGEETDGAALSFVGVSGCRILGLSVDAGGKAKFAAHATIDDEDGSSNNVTLFGCFFRGARNVPGAAQFAFGPEPGSVASGSSDVNSWRFESCSFVGGNDYYADPLTYHVDGFRTLQANNTLDVHFRNCVFGAGRSGMNNQAGSYPLTVASCAFSGFSSWAIRDSGHGSVYLGCYGESIAGVLAGTNGSVRMIGCTWRVIAGPKDYPAEYDKTTGLVGVHPAIAFEGGSIANLQQRRLVTSITNGLLALGASDAGDSPLQRPIEDGDRVWLWSDDGATGLPQASGNTSIEFTTPLYARDVDGDSLRLAATPGGPALDLAYPGTSLRVHVQPSILSGSCRQENLTVEGVAGHIPVYALGSYGEGNDALDPYDAPLMAPARSVSSRGCAGGMVARVALADVDASPPMCPRIAPSIVFWRKWLPVRVSGADLRRTSIVEVSARRLATLDWHEMGAGLILPPRAVLMGLVLRVEEAFAGIAGCTVGVRHLGDTAWILSPVSLTSTGRHPVALSTAGVEPTGTNHTLEVVVKSSVTSEWLSALSAGRANLYVDIQLEDDPDQMLGSWGT